MAGPPSAVRRCVCICAAVLAVLLVLGAVVVLVVLFLVVGGQPARVNTTCGVVEGQFDPKYKVFSFKGLPYAEPPVGESRWTRPRPKQAPCWDQVYKADTEPKACAQVDPRTERFTGDEDCLYLNVYTPAVDPLSPMPVMVYIHGGYLQWGDNHMPGYSPTERTTSKLNMVFVSVQYRLGALGFLVSSALPGGNGNYGIWDQVEALKWVQDNIGGFGGDPSQVTIFGHSSGGSSVAVLLMSPHAKGLFNRAWTTSGSALLNATLAEAVNKTDEWLPGKQVLKRRCTGGTVTAECLRRLGVRAVTKLVYPAWHDDTFDLPLKGLLQLPLLVVEGDLVPDVPFDMWRTGKGNYSDVPVLIGTTAQELDMYPPPGNDIISWSDSQLRRYVKSRLDSFNTNITTEALALYHAGEPGYDAELVFTTMGTDVRSTCASNVMAGEAAQGMQSDVYRYVVTSYPSQPIHALGFPFPARYAFHAWDTYAFFDGIDEVIPNPSSDDKEFASFLQNNIEHFVRTGKPLDVSWKPYPNVTALIGKPYKMVAAYHKDECEFWIRNNFFGYSWIN